MTIQELFIESNKALAKSISQIKTDQLHMMLPEGMSSKPTNLGNAVRYHTYDDAWVPDVLEGKTKEEVGDKYEGLLKTSDADVLRVYQENNQTACAAIAGFSDLQKTTHLSYGDFPARDYIQHIISFRAFRSYDIAKMIGADTTMSTAFVTALMEEFTPVIEGYRQMHVFPPALPVAEDADPQAKLLALVGRS